MEKILTQDNMPTLLTQLKTKMDARYASISSTTLGYEEGTWTPVFYKTTSASSNYPVSDCLAYYKKVGKICVVTICMTNNSSAANQIVAMIGGLPFVADSSFIAALPAGDAHYINAMSILGVMQAASIAGPYKYSATGSYLNALLKSSDTQYPQGTGVFTAEFVYTTK